MKKIFLLLIFCFILSSISVYSETITKDYSGGTPVFTVEGTGTITILDDNGNLVYIDDSQETGKIESFELELTAPISYFSAYIDSGEKTELINFSVLNPQKASEIKGALDALSDEDRFNMFPEFMDYMILGDECEYFYDKMDADEKKITSETIYQLSSQFESNSVLRENIEKWFLTEKILKSTWSELKYIAIEKMKIFEEEAVNKIEYEKLDSTQQSNVFKKTFNQALYISSKDDLIKYINQYVLEEKTPVSIQGGSTSSSVGNVSSKPSSGGISVGKNSSVSKPTDISVPKEDEKKVLFTDINDALWAKKEIEEMAGMGKINGYEDGKFKPNNNITRAEFVVLVKRCFELDAEFKEEVFEDVLAKDWYFNDVMIAYKKGLINGFDDKFFPNKNITRQDAAVIISRVLEAKDSYENNEITFTDADEISTYAKDSVIKLAKLGILAGMQDGSFSPMMELTRAQAATILYRCCR